MKFLFLATLSLSCGLGLAQSGCEHIERYPYIESQKARKVVKSLLFTKKLNSDEYHRYEVSARSGFLGGNVITIKELVQDGMFSSRIINEQIVKTSDNGKYGSIKVSVCIGYITVEFGKKIVDKWAYERGRKDQRTKEYLLIFLCDDKRTAAEVAKAIYNLFKPL